MEELQPDVPSLQVSVLIVSHNCVDMLRTCLQAIERAQGRETIEILVVDNGSRDGSATVDSEFPGVTVLRLPRHFGQTKARNIGIRTAKGSCLLLLSPDVEVGPDTIAALAARLEQETGALAIAPMLVDEAGGPVTESRRLPTAEVLSRCWRIGIPGDRVMVAPGETLPVELHDGRALMLRRQVIQGINYLDERFGEFWSDVDLAYQIRRAGRKILIAGDIRATVREPLASEDGLPYEADRAAGAAAYAGKHFGFFAGLGLRLKIALGALVSGRLGLFLRAIEGRKIDGNDPNL
jgi:N-acetylglucosaminyl-diphospho-decaprenol L-rhamnosyltransferase